MAMATVHSPIFANQVLDLHILTAIRDSPKVDLHGVRKPLPVAGSCAVEETKSMGYWFGSVVILGDSINSYIARVQATLLG